MPTITRKGQVTVPGPIRRRMGWKPGDDLIFAIEGDEVVVRKAPRIRDLLGVGERIARALGDEVHPAGIDWEAQREKAWREATRRFHRDDA